MWEEAFRQVPRELCPQTHSEVLTDLLWISFWERSPPAEGVQVLDAVISLGPLPGHMPFIFCSRIIPVVLFSSRGKPCKDSAGQSVPLTGGAPSPDRLQATYLSWQRTIYQGQLSLGRSESIWLAIYFLKCFFPLKVESKITIYYSSHLTLRYHQK